MKSLEFTSEQRDKLLEMCQVLFPDYNIFEIDEDGYILLILEECPAIHWFEFCMSTLAAKIDDLYSTHNKEKLESKDDNVRLTAWDRRPYHDLWSGFNFGALKPNHHPVDYLYKQYLELK